MSRAGKIARRTFLIGSAAIVGGVAFGTYAVRKPVDNPLLDDLPEGGASFNPWVLIDADKITLIAPHADKGQGVASSQAALIAEELDLEFGQFEVSFGRPDPAYWNRGLADDSVPFKSTDTRAIANGARVAMTGLTKILGLQMTGGSSTMPDSFDKLREAGAVARETLKLAASEESGVPVSQLKTEKGAVILPDGTRRPYTELAARAATLAPVETVTLREPKDWRLIGQPMQRLDIVAKSTGTTPYGIDQNQPGMVHAAVRINPRQGAGVVSFDDGEARAMRGVSDIFDITGGLAVVADNSWRAIQAAEAIDVTWEEAPYPAEQDDHWRILSESFTPKTLDKVWRDDGDADGATAGAGALSAEYRSPYVAHAPLEPLNATVLVTDDAVEVWTGHQIPRQLQIMVAEVTGHDPDQVLFHNQFIGGSFGHRLEFEFVKQAAEIADKLRGTPVKLTYSREEDFAHEFPRHIAMARARGRHENGQVTALDLDIAAPSVIASQMGRAKIPVPGPDTQIVAGSWNNPYAIPNFRVRGYRAPELAPVSSWRAVGAPGAGFFFDSFLDELIHAAGADPVAERLRLLTEPVHRKVLETAAALADWGSDLGPNRGRGVAFVESFGVPTAEIAEVTATEDGIRIDRMICVCDVGTIVDPVNFENLVQGGVIFGLSHAMNCEITYSDGQAEQANYYDHEGMRMYQCPEIIVKGLENGEKVRGIGEPPVPPAAPALANAIFAATGQRIRELPLYHHVDFV